MTVAGHQVSEDSIEVDVFGLSLDRQDDGVDLLR